jgi:hypothetical protein
LDDEDDQEEVADEDAAPEADAVEETEED